MDFKNPEAELPPLAKRVIVETQEGSMLFAKRVINGVAPKYWWIDDQSCPVRSPVIGWADPVAERETQA